MHFVHIALYSLLSLITITSTSYSQDYDVQFHDEKNYSDTVPSPDELLGYRLGDRPARYNEIVNYIKTVADRSDKAILETHGSTYEGRQLYHLIISSPENLSRLDEIRANIGKLADPRTIRSKSESDRIIKSEPAIAWMSYAIHGDELSSADAALFVAYRLTAADDPETKKLLDELIIIVDPLQNPDGRERFLAQMEQWKGTRPNSDLQSIQHTGVWPWGRGNHYLFDMNRDWFALVHPETRGKVKAILSWHPQILVDSHEMGAYDTYLMGGPRHPFNPHHNKIALKWVRKFGDEQAEAFDKYGWSYYTGEWNEEYFSGYTTSWSGKIGAIGILYEQAGIDGSIIKRPDGTLMTYRESVHHQIVSSFANLNSAANNRKEILSDYYKVKRNNVYGKNRGKRAFLIKPSGNNSRIDKFIEIMTLQQIEVEKLTSSVSVTARGYREAVSTRKQFPKGTLLVRANQPMGMLAEAILDFDQRMSTKFLKEQRRELEKHKESKIYDATAWSVLLAYGLDAYSTTSLPKVRSIPAEISAPNRKVTNSKPIYGYLMDAADDKYIVALARLLEREFSVRVAQKPFTFNGKSYSRGTALLRLHENPDIDHAEIEAIAEETGIEIRGVNKARSDKGHDLGGGYWSLLREPKIALLAGYPVSAYSFGVAWHTLDRIIGARYSVIHSGNLGRVNLDKYNVLLLPDTRGSYKNLIGKSGKKKIKSWVEGGGTLIAVGAGAAFIADSSNEFSKVRLKRQALKELDQFQAQVEREKRAEAPAVDSLDIWAEPGRAKKARDEKTKEKPKHEKSEAEKEDERDRVFRPRGVILDARLDKEHWLTFGLEQDNIPVFFASSYAFLSEDPVQTPVRLESAERIRLGGLLWPEARERWAETAFVTREKSGKGQIILFAQEANFRAYFLGSGRLMLNALFLGPGMGTSWPAPW